MNTFLSTTTKPMGWTNANTPQIYVASCIQQLYNLVYQNILCLFNLKKQLNLKIICDASINNKNIKYSYSPNWLDVIFNEIFDR